MESIRHMFSRTSISKMQVKQDRLVLLHHAKKCPHDEEDETVPCPVSPHCAATKRLWKHIAQCQHKKCPHCYSARVLLTHYRDCKDGNCPICGPVRELVRRNKEEKRRLQQQMQCPLKTDTFSTEETTRASIPSGVTTHAWNNCTHPQAAGHKSTIDEWVASNRLTIDGGGMPPSSKDGRLTIDGMRSRPPIIPILHRKSFDTMSSLSHCSSSYISSNRSSAPSSRSGGSYDTYCISCQRQGNRVGQLCSSGIRCKNNAGIAHFCKDGASQK